jgi:retron-type reverse transcriptase
VLDADITGCFDNIDHIALLKKLNTFPKLRRIIKKWLGSGVMEGEVFHKVQAGTPQGRVISPLLANIALHGLEYETQKALTEDLFLIQENRAQRCGRLIEHCQVCGRLCNHSRKQRNHSKSKAICFRMARKDRIKAQ